jgi:hypothetical protein
MSGLWQFFLNLGNSPDGGGNGAFGTRVLGVFAFGTENSEYCPIL